MINGKKEVQDISKSSNDKMISWMAPIHIAYSHGFSWYLSIILIALAIGVVFFIQKQYLSTGVVVLSAIVLIIMSQEKTQTEKYTLNNEGLLIGEKNYPFVNFKSFWITLNPQHLSLHLETINKLQPTITVYLVKVNPDEVRQILLQHLPEVGDRRSPLNEQISHIFKI